MNSFIEKATPESCGVSSENIIKFAFDSAEDLIKIGEDPIVLDNEKEDRKVDPKKFLAWILWQLV